MADDAEQTHIKVVLRVRPPNKQELAWFKSGEFHPILRDSSQTPEPDKRVIIEHSNKSYNYNKVFRENCTQKAIFTEAALPTLENVFKGYCGAVMAYGQTGTGKTHTMQGYDKTSEGDERGIIPRCADYVFRRVQREANTYQTTITMTFVQIYLDKLQDLFIPDAPEVSINPDTERVELPGITEKNITSTEDFMKNYYMGESHRVTRATLMNPTSSRGHAALIVQIRMVPHDVSQSSRIGKLVLVDLAGYERFSATGITTGIAAEEAKKINASLLALGSVVNALAEKQKHVPYRNAKLTRLLKDCLGGTSKSTIILTMNGCDRYKQESAGTLFFGFQAMSVKVDARIREEFDPAKYILTLKEKLSDAQNIISQLVKSLKSIPGAYEKHVEKYGEVPSVEAADDDDDDEQQEIVNAMLRQPSRKMSRAATMAQLKAEKLGMPPPENIVGMNSDEILQGVYGVNPNAPAEVQAVQQTWNVELQAHQEQMNKALDTLRLRHIQDLEEAKAAGVSDDVLYRLREEHEEELRMMREQNMVLKEEILRQKEKEEAQALLGSAAQTMIQSSGDSAQPGAEYHEDNIRVKEMVEHLQQTCGNKDEVLVRMFDLICLREAQIKDLETNAQAIALAQMEDAGQGTNVALDRTRQENQKLLRDMNVMRSENERLKKLLSAHPSSTSPGSLSPGRQSPVSAAMPVQQDKQRSRSQDQQQRPVAAYQNVPASIYNTPGSGPRGGPMPAKPTPTGYAQPQSRGMAPTSFQPPGQRGFAAPRGFSPQPQPFGNPRGNPQYGYR